MKLALLGSAVLAGILLTGCGGSDDNNPENEAKSSEIVAQQANRGHVLFFSTEGVFDSKVAVGNLPDMVTFTHDGKNVVVANEGELLGDEDLAAPTEDPYGSVSIVNVAKKEGFHIDFSSVEELPEGAITRIGSELARDFEPEYIAVSEDDKYAWVSLQESNAIAKINLKTKKLEKVFGLGYKDFSKAENALDFRKDDTLNIEVTPEGFYGLYQPDTIKTYRVDGKDYIVTANEGDDRDDFYVESQKAADMNQSVFDANVDDIKLRVNPNLGDSDGDGVYEKLYVNGARSFAIFDGDTGALVFDSKNEFATTVAAEVDNAYFNTRPKKGKWYDLDERSEKKGVEPESLALATVNGKTYAYIGLEKQGGFFVYDITNPQAPVQVEYNNDIDYTATIPYDKNDDVHVAPVGIDDMGPEGSVTFTQDGAQYLALANEVSGTVSVYLLENDGSATKKGSYGTGVYYDSSAEIVVYEAGKLFVTNASTNSVAILDVTNPAAITKVKDIDLSSYGTGVNSVDVHDGLLAIAVENKQ